MGNVIDEHGYVCAICGRFYRLLQDAMQCEAYHPLEQQNAIGRKTRDLSIGRTS